MRRRLLSAEGQTAAPVDPSQAALSRHIGAARRRARSCRSPSTRGGCNALGSLATSMNLRLPKAARSAGYIKAVVVNQGTDPTKFIIFSVDEETSSWLNGYFGVILKSVTLDGWVVIGILDGHGRRGSRW